MRTTGNPTLAQSLSGDLTRRARRGLVAEFDMQTQSGGALTDLSGNGYNATLAGGPQFTSEGLAFTGSQYADFILPNGLGLGYSMAIVFKAAANGYVVFGSRNSDDQVGSWVRSMPDSIMVTSGIANNDAKVTPLASLNAYSAITAKVYPFGQARGRLMGTGTLGYRSTLRPDGVADTRARWRIGGGANTSGTNHDNPYLLLDQGTIAYIMLFNIVTSEDQDGAILEYLAAKLLPRGIPL